MEPDEPRDAAAAPDLRAQGLSVSAPGSTPRYFESELRMLPGVYVPLRSMLVDGATDRILISPVGTKPETEAVRGGPITLVAPSLLHHLHLKAAIEQLGPREVWGPPGFPERHPAFSHVKVFGRDLWPHSHQLATAVVEGAPRRNEVVFFHRASRSIYTADLVFNILAPHGFLTPIAYRVMGIYKRFGVARMWRRWVEDRAAFQRSIERILGWDFDRIVMAHGAIVETGGKLMLEGALREQQLLREPSDHL